MFLHPLLFFFVLMCSLAQGVSVPETVLLLGKDKTLHQALNLFPLTIKRRSAYSGILEVEIPREFSRMEFERLLLKSIPGLKIETNLPLIMPKPDTGAGKSMRASDWLPKNWIQDLFNYFPAPTRQIRVGVIDSGIQEHRLLHTIREPKGDPHGHGTHVAGILCAHDSQTQIGVTTSVEVRDYPVLDHLGQADLMDLITALVKAREDGCHILNLSLGLPVYSSLLYDTLTQLAQDGIILVAAAGNSASVNPVYPAAHPMVIGVGSIGLNKRISAFSNQGANTKILALGENIESTWNDGGLKILSGTSMAAPLFTGVLAEILSRIPMMRHPKQVLQAVEEHRLKQKQEGRQPWLDPSILADEMNKTSP